MLDGPSTPESLVDRLRLVAMRVFRPWPILAAYVFGSRLSGAGRPDSDLDIGYYLHDYRQGAVLSVRDEMRLALEISDAIGVEVDLRNLACASLEFRGRVLEQGRRIYSADDVARVTLERELLARYHDYKDEFRAMHEMRLQTLARRGL